MADDTQKQTGTESAPAIEKRVIIPPRSGAQRAKRLLIVLVGILLCAVLWAILHNSFLRPVRKYYKGLEKQSAEKMCEAFPVWLIQADPGEGNLSVYDMCAAALSYTKFSQGENFKVKVGLEKKEAVDRAYLDKIASGISTQFQTDVKISKGWWLTLQLTYRAGDTDATATQYVRVYRINGKWVMLDIPSDSYA